MTDCTGTCVTTATYTASSSTTGWTIDDRTDPLHQPLKRNERIFWDPLSGLKFKFTPDFLSPDDDVKYTPKKIIYNGPATIVFWKDGTKTIVKRSKKDKDNKYNAFCAALSKKIYGSNSRLTSIVESGIVEK